ncbi:MAG: hydrolase [Leptospiraceae bacterium]|nr:MAG: hydrolase [Leptospiraceae bacterium]
MVVRNKINFLFYFVLLNFVFSCTTYNEKELAKTFYPDGKYITIDKFEIFILEKNLEIKNQKTPIILVHGFSSNVHTWEHYLEYLEKDYPVIAFDLPGFGFSSKPDVEYTRKGYVNILNKIIEYYNFNKVILIGNSMGGEISLRYTINYPYKVEKLVLIDAGGLMNKKDLPWFLQWGKTFIMDYFNFLFRNRIAISYMLKSAFYNKNVVNERKIDLYYMPLKTQDGINAHKSLLNSSYEKISIEEMKKISVPVLILWGENDEWIPLKYALEFKKYLNNSILVILPECGHLPQEEKPEESFQYIKTFIEK